MRFNDAAKARLKATAYTNPTGDNTPTDGGVTKYDWQEITAEDVDRALSGKDFSIESRYPFQISQHDFMVVVILGNSPTSNSGIYDLIQVYHLTDESPRSESMMGTVFRNTDTGTIFWSNRNRTRGAKVNSVEEGITQLVTSINEHLGYGGESAIQGLESEFTEPQDSDEEEVFDLDMQDFLETEIPQDEVEDLDEDTVEDLDEVLSNELKDNPIDALRLAEGEPTSDDILEQDEEDRAAQDGRAYHSRDNSTTASFSERTKTIQKVAKAMKSSGLKSVEVIDGIRELIIFDAKVRAKDIKNIINKIAALVPGHNVEVNKFDPAIWFMDIDLAGKPVSIAFSFGSVGSDSEQGAVVVTGRRKGYVPTVPESESGSGETSVKKNGKDKGKDKETASLYDQYKVRDRVIINKGSETKPVYYLGTITKKNMGDIYVQLDDGTSGSYKATYNRSGLVGRSMIKARRVVPIPVHHLHNFLIQVTNPNDGVQPNFRPYMNDIEKAHVETADAKLGRLIPSIEQEIYNSAGFDSLPHGYVERLAASLGLKDTTSEPARLFLAASVAYIIHSTDLTKKAMNAKLETRLHQIIQDHVKRTGLEDHLIEAYDSIESLVETITRNL